MREAGRRVLNMRHFDVQLIGGLALHRGTIAEMKTGEGKTLVATLAAYLNALAGQGRPRRHRQRLPGQARQRVDGPDLPVPGPQRGRHPALPGRPGAPGGLRRRHHLRDQQRVRLRLPARQHEVRPRAATSSGGTTSRWWTRWTRSSSTRRARRSSSAVRPRSRPTSTTGSTPSSPSSSPARASRGDQKAEERAELEKTGRLHRRREGQDGDPDRAGDGPRGEAPRRAEPLGPSNMDILHHVNQGLRAHTLFQRDVDYVVNDGQVIIVDEFTGRLMPGPALVGRPAPGGGGQGEGQDRAREPDPRDHHLPELLPHVREARRA